MWSTTKAKKNVASERPAGQHPLLNFTPLNPENSDNSVEEEVRPAETFELTNNQWENGSEASDACKLNLYDVLTEFPLPKDSIEGERRKKYIVDIHRELVRSGYALKNGDIVSSSPLTNQARDSSKSQLLSPTKTRKQEKKRQIRQNYGTQGREE